MLFFHQKIIQRGLLMATAAIVSIAGGGLAASATAAEAGVEGIAKPTTGTPAIGATATSNAWPAYRAFVDKFVSPEGRVIDFSTAVQQTTSEGQSYGLFFALVANDRAAFDRLLNWTANNLTQAHFAPGDLRLPSWQWGRKKDGSFGVLDTNSASDSDIWIAYDLLQAGRLWSEPKYTKLGMALAEEAAKREVVNVEGLGPMLIPGPQGFQKDGVTRLNPSYLPLPVLRGLAQALPNGPWSALADNGLAMVKAIAPHGFSPDWAAWKGGQFIADPESKDTGSYDAIRTYLWAGMASPRDPLANPWLDALGGMRKAVADTGMAPERATVSTGAVSGQGPLSYWGALAPYFKALGDTKGLWLARAKLAVLDAPAATDPHTPNAPVYYDWVLGLFGSGFADGRFAFDERGNLAPNWAARH